MYLKCHIFTVFMQKSIVIILCNDIKLFCFLAHLCSSTATDGLLCAVFCLSALTEGFLWAIVWGHLLHYGVPCAPPRGLLHHESMMRRGNFVLRERHQRKFPIKNSFHIKGHIGQGQIIIPKKGRWAHNNIKLLHCFVDFVLVSNPIPKLVYPYVIGCLIARNCTSKDLGKGGSI